MQPTIHPILAFSLLFFYFSLTPVAAQYTGMSPYLPERGGLMMNEISNGPVGATQEYVEFVVVGAPTAPSAAVDLRGWIMDDNNFPASGQGNAPGHLVFGDCYAAIPPGSILVVYNADDPNPVVPTDDPMDMDGDGVYIIPHNDPCMDACFSNPSFENPLFCPCEGAIGNPIAWQFGLRNEGDVVQLRNPCETVAQAIHWGGVSLTDEIINAPMQFSFPDPQTGRLFRCHNGTNQDYHDPINWDNPTIAGNETPGAPNSPDNANWIMNLQSGNFFSIGLIWDCRDTDAGDLTPPMDAISGVPPIQICQGDDLSAFGTTYIGNDEFIPDAVGFTFEYAYLLTESNPPFNVLDFNLSGDFDLSTLAVGTYLVWGFSYIQTNGSISVTEFLTNEGISIENILAFTGCGYHSDLENLDLAGTPMMIEVLEPPVALLPSNLPSACQSATLPTFDLTQLEGDITGGSGLPLSWFTDGGLNTPLLNPQNFTTGSTTVFAVVSNGVCPDAVIEIPIDVFEAVSVTVSQGQEIDCHGNHIATISSTVMDGQAPYSYAWNTGGLTGPSPGNLGPGTYILTVTDANGCEGTDSLSITEPEALMIDCVVQSQVSQFGGMDGAAEIALGGGTAPLLVQWFGPVLGESTLLMAGSLSINNLPAGTYSVLVTDANNCTIECDFTIEEPPCGLTVEGTILEPSCAGIADGQIDLTIANGLAPYSITWNSGELTEDLINLPGGTYQVTITDQAGCFLSDSFILETPQALQYTATTEDPLCFENARGSIMLDSILGGKPPYQVSLDGAPFIPITSQPLMLNELDPGAYTLTLEDAQGCYELFEVEIAAPQELQVDLGDDQVILLGATVNLTAFTNFSPDFYVWTSDLEGTLPAVDGFLTIRPEETTTYTVLAIDENGCQVEDRVTIFVNRERQVYIPNAISPNDDGQNDRFLIYSGGDVLEILSLRVFDRWGEMVYEATNIAPNDEPNGWDGTFRGRDMNTGVFIYVAEIQFIDGITEVFKGDLSLLR